MSEVEALRRELQNTHQLVDLLRPYRDQAQGAERRLHAAERELAELRDRNQKLSAKVGMLQQLLGDAEAQNAKLKAMVTSLGDEPRTSSGTVGSGAEFVDTKPPVKFEAPAAPAADTSAYANRGGGGGYGSIVEAAEAAADAPVDPLPASSRYGPLPGATKPLPAVATGSSTGGGHSPTEQRPRPSGGAVYAIAGGKPRASGATGTAAGTAVKRERDAGPTYAAAPKANRPEQQRPSAYGHFGGRPPQPAARGAARRASNASPSPGTVTGPDGRYAPAAEHLGQVFGPGDITPSPAAIPPPGARPLPGAQLGQPKQLAFGGGRHGGHHGHDSEHDTGDDGPITTDYPVNPAPSRSNVLSTPSGPGGAVRSALKRPPPAPTSVSGSRQPSSIRNPSPSGTDGHDGRHAPRVAGRQPQHQAVGSSARAGTGFSHAESHGSIPIDSPMPANPQAGADIPRVFVASMLTSDEKATVKAIINRIGMRARFLELPPGTRELPPEVTHVVSQQESSSEKALMALVTGRYVVEMTYMLQCRDAGFWVTEDGSAGVSALIPTRPLAGVEVVVDDEAIGDHADSVNAVLKAARAHVLHVAHHRTRDIANVEVQIRSADDLVNCIRDYQV